MRLKKITLRNFRCFEQLELDLHPRMTVLVGENGAGKTALLDGIAAGLTPVLRYFSSANQRLSAEGVGIKDTDFRLVAREGRGGREQWLAAEYAQVITEVAGGLTWDYWRPSVRGSAPESRIGESALAAHVKTIADNLYTASPSLLPVFAYYGAQRGRIEIPERLRQSKEDYGHPTSALVGSLDSLSDFKEMLKWFDTAEAVELRINKGRIPDEFELSPALQAVRCATTRLLGGEYQNPYFNADHRFVVEKADGRVPLQVAQLSQGYQSMLALGMDFARRLALANPQLTHDPHEDAPIKELLAELIEFGWPYAEDEELPEAPLLAPAIMLVDEIDLHLHPAWQQRVLADLMRTFPLTQFIVTTHSPQVLTSVDASSVRLIREEIDPESGERRTVVKKISQQTKGVASSDILLEIMGVNPTPPVEEANWLADYIARIENGTHTDPEGLSLRQKLESHFGASHPLMLDTDRLIRFQTFKLRRQSAAEE